MHPLLTFTIDFFNSLNIRAMLLGSHEPFSDSQGVVIHEMLFSDPPRCIADLRGIDPDFEEKRIVYLTTDIFRCRYVLMPIPADLMDAPDATHAGSVQSAEARPDDAPPASKILFIGPFLTENPSITTSREIIKQYGIPPTYTQLLTQYLSTVPMILKEMWIEEYLNTLAKQIYRERSFGIQSLVQGYTGQNTVKPPEEMASEERSNTAAVIRSLRARYEKEELLMDTIARGDARGAERLLEDMVFNTIEARIPNLLRNRKNYAIVSNTIFRKAAQRGHVNAIHLDEMSRKYAILIEQAGSVHDVTVLVRHMVRDYALLVQRENTAGYSPAVREAVNYISLHLTESDLTLASVAEALTLNKTYLAARFKQETGATVTDFIHSRRIDHAIFLMSASDITVHDAALACGMSDLGYFSKVFKREKGMSPREYRKSLPLR